MVYLTRILATSSGVGLQKRDTTAWSSVVRTTLDFWSEATSVTIYGYYTTTLVASAGTAVISSVKETTSTSIGWATPALLTSAPLDPACTTAFSAWNRNLSFVTSAEQAPAFQVGFDPKCLPTSYYSAAYYSPAICPPGYKIAFTPVVVSTSKLETFAKCCYSSYKWDDKVGCLSYFNPAIATSDVGSPGANTVTKAGLTAWTVIAAYTSVSMSTSIFTTGAIQGGSATSLPTTSVTEASTTTGHTIISGDGAAIVIGPDIAIRWATTDQAVLQWLDKELNKDIIDGNATTNGTTAPSMIPHKAALSPGVLAGIIISAVCGLALIVAALLLCLHYRKRRAAQSGPNIENSAGPSLFTTTHAPPAYAGSIAPKSELDATATGRYNTHSAVSSPIRDDPSFSSTSDKSSHIAEQYYGPHVHLPMASELQVSELQASTPRPQTTVSTSTFPSLDRTSGPVEWRDLSRQPTIDMSGLPIGDSIAAAGPSANATRLEQLKAEKARLQRLQHISEMEAKLEEQIERDLKEERQPK